jgi:hypothetical protein
MSLIVEAMSSALDVSRARVKKVMETVTAEFEAARGELTRSVDAALSRDGSSSSRADELTAIAHRFIDSSRELKMELLTLVTGAGGAWGIGLVAAGATVTAVSGVTIAATAAMILGVLLIMLSGQSAIMVMRELCDRISSSLGDLKAAQI